MNNPKQHPGSYSRARKEKQCAAVMGKSEVGSFALVAVLCLQQQQVGYVRRHLSVKRASRQPFMEKLSLFSAVGTQKKRRQHKTASP